jgi:hypothetical protein
MRRMTKKMKKTRGDSADLSEEMTGYFSQSEMPKEVFATGAQRDTSDGKSRIDLIDPVLLERVGHHLAKGAKHYGEHNWQRGIPTDRYLESLCRHVNAYRMGNRDEDHLSAIVFNVMGIMRNEAYAAYNNEPHVTHDWGLW